MELGLAVAAENNDRRDENDDGTEEVHCEVVRKYSSSSLTCRRVVLTLRERIERKGRERGERECETGGGKQMK